ncbi:MAG: hypothetical protein WAL87_00630 [Chthoniobacterales bacterium]
MFRPCSRRLPLLLAVFLTGMLLPLNAAPETKKTPPPQATKGNAPEVVEVGVWPTVIYNLDVHSNTFYMTAYVWFIWRGEIDPTQTVEFTNNVESWGLTKMKTYPKPITFPDGRHYQSMRIEGRFFQPFSLLRFPLENHTVSLSIEDNTYAADKLLYRFDQRHSGLDSGLTIPGWTVQSWKGREGVHHYASNMGDETVGSDSSDYGTILFEVKVTRPVNFFIWKMLLPLIIIMVACWTALLLHPSQLASRAAMTGTALLTTVFMQQGYTSNLPEVNYLVLMDKIYVVVYLLIILSLVQVVIQGAMEKKHVLDDYRKAQLIDKVSVVVQAMVFMIALWVIIVTTY